LDRYEVCTRSGAGLFIFLFNDVFTSKFKKKVVDRGKDPFELRNCYCSENFLFIFDLAGLNLHPVARIPQQKIS
jgi:hypothetical protein